MERVLTKRNRPDQARCIAERRSAYLHLAPGSPRALSNVVRHRGKNAITGVHDAAANHYNLGVIRMDKRDDAASPHLYAALEHFPSAPVTVCLMLQEFTESDLL